MSALSTEEAPGTATAPGGRRRSLKSRAQHRGWAAVFLSPALIIIGGFVLIPILLTVWISLHEWSMFTSFGDMRWVGLENYQSVLTGGNFRSALFNTVVYAVMVVAMTLPLAFLISLLLYFPTQRGRGLVRTILFATYVIPTVAVTLVWSTLYAPNYGPFDQILGVFGIDSFGWTSDPDVALFSLALFNVWQMLGYYTVLLIAGLTQIPGEIYEAATMDGAGRFRQTISITLPLLSRTLVFVVMMAIINAVQVFDPVYLLTQGGPSNATNVLTFEIQKQAFQFGLAGQASAMAVSFLVLIVAVAGAVFGVRRFRR